MNTPPTGPKEKVCRMCWRLRPLSEFYPLRGTTRFHSYCKQCFRCRVRELRADAAVAAQIADRQRRARKGKDGAS